MYFSMYVCMCVCYKLDFIPGVSGVISAESAHRHLRGHLVPHVSPHVVARIHPCATLPSPGSARSARAVSYRIAYGKYLIVYVCMYVDKTIFIYICIYACMYVYVIYCTYVS